MLQLFRTNQLLFGFLLLFYALALRFAGVGLPPVEGATGVWTDAVQQLFGGSVSRYIFGCLLLTGQAVYLNFLVARNRLSRDPSQFAGLFYILFSCLLPAFLDLSGPLLANTFFILAYGELSSTYKKNQAATALFNAGLWIGIASLFYVGYLVFLPWLFTGINSLRKPSLREWLIGLLGTLCVYWLAGVGYFLLDAWPYFREVQLGSFSWLNIQSDNGASDWLQGAVIGLLMLITLGQVGSLLSRNTIDVRKKINLLYVALLFSPFFLLFQPAIYLEAFLLLAVPLGTLIGLRFVRLSPAVGEALHLVVLVAVLVWQYWGRFFGG